MNAQTAESKPSQYQKDLLKDAGVRRRPRTYAGAKKLIDQLEPSDGQKELLTEIGLSAGTRAEASALITQYEKDHPQWAAARRAARSSKAKATRTANKAAGQETNYNATILAYRQAGVDRHGTTAASIEALALLRSLALRLPEDSEERKLQFGAMRKGLSAREIRERIDEVTGLLAG